MSNVKRTAKMTGLVLLMLLAAGAVWLTKPWDDLQTWRLRTMLVEWLRADVFTHWEVIQPVAPLTAPPPFAM